MGRRKSGRTINGWVILDKPAGVGSTDMVTLVRRAFDARKAGHSGTLDPAATGLLAIALGEATKVIPHIADALKAYDFTVRLGQATDTDDADGTVTVESALRPTDAEIAAALVPMTGDILQVPPQYSAVRVDGERAHAVARRGDTAEIAARPLYVDSLEMTGRPDADHVHLHMVCGKGGYVRAIARDMGEALGCHAHVAGLRRVWSGPFDVARAVTPDAVRAAAEAGTVDDLLLPLEAGLAELPEARVSEIAAARLRNGNPGEVLSTDAAFGEAAWASCRGTAVALGTYRAGMLHPTRVLVRP
ncbi:tRNA pseudouridine(55) synthase TruB [Rhodobacteraceae bacterium CCMM004]|nr:tRNA pseudouridine(55) synthase TruB [Rhodobacteraceae bacterium CCMM004]